MSVEIFPGTDHFALFIYPNILITLPPTIYNISQHRNKSVISGTLFFHNLGHSVICTFSSFFGLYLIQIKTGLDFGDIHGKITFWK